jgi:hypothetical protein
MVRPGSRPQEAARIALGRASSHREFGRSEAAEDHRMDGADPRAGQHRHQRLGDHRHVDHHAVALADALRLQGAAERGRLRLKLGEAGPALGPGDGGIVDDRSSIAVSRLDMAIDRVPADVADRVVVPAVERRS